MIEIDLSQPIHLEGGITVNPERSTRRPLSRGEQRPNLDVDDAYLVQLHNEALQELGSMGKSKPVTEPLPPQSSGQTAH